MEYTDKIKLPEDLRLEEDLRQKLARAYGLKPEEVTAAQISKELSRITGSAQESLALQEHSGVVQRNFGKAAAKLQDRLDKQVKEQNS